MNYKKDKFGSGLSILGYGCMRLPKKFADAENLILKAVEQGVNYFDTAYIYPDSEETLGKIFTKHGLHGKVKIATKLPVILCKRPEDFEKFFKIQLARLQTECVEFYFLHMLSSAAQLEKLEKMGIFEWLESKRANGQIKQIGFSYHGSCTDFLKILERYDWDLCLVQYNYSDENYQAGRTGVEAAHKKGIPVIIMEPLLGGRLAVNLPPKLAKHFAQDKNNASPAAWALKWLWNQPEVTVVLSGMNSQMQLEENLQTASQSLPGMFGTHEQEFMQTAQELFKESNKINCTGCGYCMPCPVGVNIPAGFAAYNACYSMGKYQGLKGYYMSAGLLSPQTGFASKCVGCKKCEKHCPQNLPVAATLQTARKKLEPWWTKPIVWGTRKFLLK
ncbi:MAG: aldo/keto reductase [Oscillospiraceae bacterium]|jgi:predicted aldo/keto reductase-like oxidoreductase|nr:aldo/keto reductase [Oscillospiraceae bacterium]